MDRDKPGDPADDSPWSEKLSAAPHDSTWGALRMDHVIEIAANESLSRDFAESEKNHEDHEGKATD